MSKELKFSLYQHLSVKAQVKLFSAIFFTFAPLALMTTTVFGENMPWQLTGFWILSSGIIAVGWAYSFIRNVRFLFVVIPLQALIITGQISLGIYFEVVKPEISLSGILVVAFIVIGYVFYVSFINSEGMRSYRLQTEINLAKEIHDHLVPAINFSNNKVELYGVSVAAGEVGGDLLDMVEMDEEINCFVADVSGHGVRAGVMMGMMKSAIRMKMRQPHSGSNFVDSLNDVLYELKRPDMFATFAGLQFGTSGEVTYVNAGHLPILHFQQATGQFQKLDSTYPPLAVLPGQQFDGVNLTVRSGDLLVLVTDGFVEVFDKNEQEFGQTRLEKIILEHAGEPLANIYENLLKETRLFGLQSDDQTFLAVRIK